MPTQETDFTQYELVPGEASNEVQALPEVLHSESMTNLANGGSHTFDFNMDFTPIFDAFCYADQVLTMTVYVRQSSSDTFRALGASTPANVAGQIGNPLSNRRMPGSQVRVVFTNSSGVATTSLSVQVHARSI
jgi:hypothetical protein